MILSLGGDYAWMMGCTSAVVALCVVIPQRVDGTPTVLRIGLLVYAWLAVIAVTGGALSAKRAVLERETAFTCRGREPQSLEDTERRRDRWLDSIYAAWRSNAREIVWRLIMDGIDAHQEPLEELRWLYSRVASWDQPQLANRLVHEMLPRLLAARRDGEALGLVKERLRIDPHFRPRSRDARRRIAQLAGEWGDRSTSEILQRDLRE
jgi:hypothetical protein